MTQRDDFDHPLDYPETAEIARERARRIAAIAAQCGEIIPRGALQQPASSPIEEEVLVRDDVDAATRFFDAVDEAPVDAEEDAASQRAGATTYDFSRYRARRIRERLLGLLDALHIAIERRDLGAVWTVLDEADACRCFPPAVREEALALAQLPSTSLPRAAATLSLSPSAHQARRRATRARGGSGTAHDRRRADGELVEAGLPASSRAPVPRSALAGPRSAPRRVGPAAVGRTVRPALVPARRATSRRPHPVLLASRPDAPDAEASALVDLIDDALAHGTDRSRHRSRRPVRRAEQPDEALLPAGRARRADEGRHAALLSRRRPGHAAASRRAAGGAHALPRRRGRRRDSTCNARPSTGPAWVTTCTTAIKPPRELTFLRIESTAMLAWVANLGAIELHPWYSRCSAPTQARLPRDRPRSGQEGTRFEKVRAAALHVKEALDAWSLPAFIKTSGARGCISSCRSVRGPTQREVHDVARDIAIAIAARHPRLFTTEYRIANRPRGTVLLDYNQNSAGHTLAGAYSVRPTPSATVSTPTRLERRTGRRGPARLHARHGPDAALAARRPMARIETRRGEAGSAVVEREDARWWSSSRGVTSLNCHSQYCVLRTSYRW